MNKTCNLKGCRGRMYPLSDNPLYFRFKCGNCGRIVKQHKRRSQK